MKIQNTQHFWRNANGAAIAKILNTGNGNDGRYYREEV